MDDDDLEPSKFVTESDDQDSLDERIDTEQRIRNQQLWASFQNAACCITKLYKDRSQPTVSLWNPFQNAASNLTTLYKDCIDSQRRFAKIGYQVGRRRHLRELKKLIKKHQQKAKQQHQQSHHGAELWNRSFLDALNTSDESTHGAQATSNQQQQQQHQHQHQHQQQQQQRQQQQQQQNNVSSILAVNQLNLDCDDSPSQSMQTQPLVNQQFVPENNQQHQQSQNHNQNYDQSQQQHQSNTGFAQSQLISNNDDDLVTFQQALVEPVVVRIKSGQNKRPCLNTSGYLNNRTIDPSDSESEKERLLELNAFLADEYHRHVGSRKRSCPSSGSSPNKRARE